MNYSIRIYEAFSKALSLIMFQIIFTVQKALLLLLDGASIILNGSNSFMKGDPDLTVYCATEAAVRSYVV